MDVRNYGATLLTMIQLQQNFNFWIWNSLPQYRVSHREFVGIEKGGWKSIMTRSNPDLYQSSYLAISPCLPWARSCQHLSLSSLAARPGQHSHWSPAQDSNCEAWRIYQSAMKRLHNLNTALTGTGVKLESVSTPTISLSLAEAPSSHEETPSALLRWWRATFLLTLGLTICT